MIAHTLRVTALALAACAAWALAPCARAQQSDPDSDRDPFGAVSVAERARANLALKLPKAGERGFVSARPLSIALSPTPTLTLKGLPALRSSQPLHGYLRLGRGGKMAFVLDQSAPATRGYDLLYLDRNQDFDLSNDGAAASGKTQHVEERKLDYGEFTAVEIDVYFSESVREKAAFTFYLWYPKSGLPDRMFCVSASWREGEVQLGDARARIVLYDEDADAAFDLENTTWGLVELPPAGAPPQEMKLVPAKVPLRVRGVPYQPAQVMPEGRRVELQTATEANTREAELSNDPDLVEPPRARAEKPLAWQTDLDAALAQAKAHEQPVFLLFSVDWVPAAKRLESRTLMDQEVQTTLGGKFVCVKVNPDVDLLAAGRYDVKGCPTAIVINREGKVVDRFLGYRSARTLAELLRKYR